MPAFNEAPRIGASLERIVGYLRARETPFEVLVADDGSTDATPAIVETYPATEVRLLRLPENRGKGAATRAGALASRHDLVLVSDADLATPIEELESLSAFVDEAAVVIASRQVAGARVARTVSRRIASKMFSLALWSMGLCRGLHDTQCGFKLLRGDAARRLFSEMELDGFGFDIELLELARYHGMEIREVGVSWQASGESSVSLLRHGPRMLGEALAVRRRIRGLRSGSTGDGAG